MSASSAAKTVVELLRFFHGASDRGIAIDPKQRGRFGRMFPTLAARPAGTPTADDIGRAGGPMDALAGHQDNPRIPAAMTYLGQFLDHDITLDATSSLEQQNDPLALENFRTPAFELDSLYGGGPAMMPFLYDATKPGKFLLGPNPAEGEDFDLPRNPQGTALIGDPRNDENLIVAQLHVAFLKFHNAMVDQMSSISDGVNDSGFVRAQRLTRWHYQWMILHEFLPLTVGQATVDDVLKKGRKFYKWKKYPFIPVEFSVAAYRFGHSQVQPGYAVNPTFGAALFPADPGASGPRTDLQGGPIQATHKVNWKFFIDTNVPFPPLPPPATRQSSLIDTKIAGPLLNLPFSVIPNIPGVPRSLATRNLLRGEKLGLPSGQDVARKMKLPVLTPQQIWPEELQQHREKPAPLWFYILREAEVQNGGKHLGAVGGRIVAEVFIGLLQGDIKSYINVKPKWKPVAQGVKTPNQFGLADLLRIAGTDVD